MIIQKQYKMDKDVFKKTLGAHGDVFGAKGDVFGAKGVMYNPKNDVFGAGGSISSSRRDVFKRANETLTGLNRLESDKPDASQETLSTEDADKKGFFYYMKETLGLVDTAVDIRNKWESGVSTEESGVQMDIAPQYEAPKKDNTIWYIGVGIVAILVIVGVVYARKNK